MFTWNFTLDTIDQAVEWLLTQMGEARVLAFRGSMGAGKTTFITALCRAWQVEDTVGSPTFAIINQYTGIKNQQPANIYHMDLYRLSGEEEAARAGVEDALYSGDICLVEWPEKAAGLFPPDTIYIDIAVAGPVERKLIIGRN